MSRPRPRPTPPSGPATWLTAARRERELGELADGRRVDVLVVGGGVTGVGVALDAASRGLSVALVERGDLAQGTSRWSSKLIHGGLRYLANGQVGVAWESARERAVLAAVTAPHLVRALPQVTPLLAGGSAVEAAALRGGFRAGDAMRALAGTSHRRLPSMRSITAAEARMWAPALRTRGVRGALLAWDGQLEDDARLVVALARTAAAHGARVLTHCGVERLTGDGAVVRDERTGTSFDLRADHVVNATGVWAGGLVGGLALRPSRGSHLLVRADRLGHPRAMVNVPVPGHFGRFVFAVPRPDGLVLVGLTDEPVEGPVPDVPVPTAAEEAFLLQTASLAFDRPLAPDDVVGRFAGLRPLLDAGDGTTADVSRRHAVVEDAATGAVTVVGGKLTTYRQMAEDAVDVVAARPGVAAGPCRTRALPVVGAQRPGPRRGIPRRLVDRYGAEAAELVALAGGRPALLEPVAPGVPVLGVELLAGVEREGALTAEDLLERRTRLGLVPGWAAAAAPAAREALTAASASDWAGSTAP